MVSNTYSEYNFLGTLIDRHWALTSKRCCQEKESAMIDIGRIMTERQSNSGISGTCRTFLSCKYFVCFNMHMFLMVLRYFFTERLY